MKIKLTKEQFHLISSIGNMVNDGEDDYYHLPFWFKSCDDGSFEIIKLEKVPNHVIQIIKDSTK